MKIKKFQLPDAPIPQVQIQTTPLQDNINKGLDLAEEFYQSDVIPRAKRERSLQERFFYKLPSFSRGNILFGDSDSEDNSYQWNNERCDGYYSHNNRRIYIRPTDNVDDYGNVITHEMAHRNLYDVEDDHSFKSALSAWGPNHIGRVVYNKMNSSKAPTCINITPTEASYLDTAYKVSDTPYFEDSKLMVEKHATNRDIRYNIWLDLRKELGRTPTMDEVDAKIKSLNSEQLRKYHTNGYTSDYEDHPEWNDFDEKNALIHVAQNTHNPFQQNNTTYYAKLGGKLNYLNYIKL